MATLRIALQDGFEGDTVVIRVNGREAFKDESVKTKRQIGKAASCEVEVPDGPAKIEISLPLKTIAETIAIDVAGESYLGISVVKNRIEHRISAEPFRYA